MNDITRNMVSVNSDSEDLIHGTCEIMKANNIAYQRVDSVVSWGNMNQDWIEFECELETSWGWPRLLFMSEDRAEDFFRRLQNGKLILMMSYIEEKDGKKEYVPHH